MSSKTTRGRRSEECLTSSEKVQQVTEKKRGPVIVYVTSPKIIKVRPEEFRGLVQQLTGNQASMHPSHASY